MNEYYRFNGRIYKTRKGLGNAIMKAYSGSTGWDVTDSGEWLVLFGVKGWTGTTVPVETCKTGEPRR